MRRFRLPSALLLALLAVLWLGVPGAAQGGETPTTLEVGRVRMVVEGDLVLPAGDRADLVVVIDGDARIEGDAGVVIVVEGTLTLTSGATVDSLAIIHGTADVQAGATVTRDIMQLDSTVIVDPAASFDGEVRSLAVDFAGIGVVLGILGLLVWFAFALLTWIAGLLLAAFGARQVRSAEWLISREPGKTFLAGLGMVVLPPIVAILLLATVVLVPVGLALLLIVWPVLAFVGWLVGATWIGEWVLRTAGRERPEHRPYLGVTLGLVLATLGSLVPLVGGLISIFGMGGIALSGWRMLRTPERPPAPVYAAYPGMMPPYPPAGPPYPPVPPMAPPPVTPPPPGPGGWPS